MIECKKAGPMWLAFFYVICVQRKHWVQFGCRLFVVASLAKAALKSARSGYEIRRHVGCYFQGS